MLKLIKLTHTVIWMAMAAATGYIFYAGIKNIFNTYLYISIALLLVESIVLLINRWTCPLTSMARKYTTDTNDNFDIYLPNWIATYNKMIFGTIFITGLLLVLINYIW